MRTSFEELRASAAGGQSVWGFLIRELVGRDLDHDPAVNALCEFLPILGHSQQVDLSVGSVARCACPTHSCAFWRHSFARSTDMASLYIERVTNA